MIQNHSVEIGVPVNEDEVRAIGAMMTQSLFFPTLEEFDWIAVRGRENMRVIRRNGRVAGALGLIKMGQWFGGRRVPMAGFSPVAVSPEYRSGGVASELMRHVLTELHDEGFPLAGLYPATQPVYRRAGFEQAGTMIKYKIAANALDARDRSLTVRAAEESDHDTIRSLYTQRAMRTSGNLDRSESMWMRIFQSTKATKYMYIVERDASPEGYIVYTQGRHATGLMGNLDVLDLVAVTPAAARRLLTFLTDHRSIIADITWTGGPADPLFLLIANQAYRVEHSWQWMLRILDVERALEARGYPHGLEAEIHLDVSDDWMAWNNGRLVLQVSRGRGSVRPGGDGVVQADIRGLATMYTGHLSPTELLMTDYVHGPLDALDEVGRVFSGPAPWMPDMF